MKILFISRTHGTNIDRISAYADELRREHDFPEGKKNPCTKAVFHDLHRLHRH